MFTLQEAAAKGAMRVTTLFSFTFFKLITHLLLTVGFEPLTQKVQILTAAALGRGNLMAKPAGDVSNMWSGYPHSFWEIPFNVLRLAADGQGRASAMATAMWHML